MLANTGNVSVACEAIGEPRNTVYGWRNADPTFAEAWARAKDLSGDVLEDEATRRAVHGVEEPVFHKGIEVATVRKYSDTLLIFLLKGAKPDKYKDRVAADHTVAGSLDVNVEAKDAPDVVADLFTLAAQRREKDGSDLV